MFIWVGNKCGIADEKKFRLSDAHCSGGLPSLVSFLCKLRSKPFPQCLCEAG